MLFFVVSYLGLASHQAQPYPPYVSHSPSPSGLKGIYTYLEEEYSISVDRWSNEPQFLPQGGDGGGHLLIMMEPSFVPTETEMSAYKEFMESGNTILLVSDNPIGMLDVRVEFTGPGELEEGTLSMETMEGEGYQGQFRSNVRIQQEPNDRSLLTDSLGAIALKRTVGEGTLIVANSPDWFVNSMILEEDHLSLALMLVEAGIGDEAGTIYFDEYIHGGSPSITTIYPMAFLILFVQGVVVTALWLWYRGKRFGPILKPREEFVRFSDESLRALGAWYLRTGGKGYHEALGIQVDYVKQLMQERWGVPMQKSWKERQDILEQKWHKMPKQEIQPFLDGLVTVLRKDKISKQEYLLWSKKLDRLRKGVEEG
ncbi:MAG: DUF4350 domain-containing protein [Bacillus sp. (in: Bacteria)]|nr:DUF4350 domain-containing protein [Bacillus sp. (in: firmicutes)]